MNLAQLERRVNEESQLWIIATGKNVTPQKTFKTRIITTDSHDGLDVLRKNIEKQKPAGANAFEIGVSRLYGEQVAHPICYYTISEYAYQRAMNASIS
ncbi:MAG: hypothetical protein M1165_01735 [Candidatus Pacearchaeota archaeon]|nr:hypothetical protein [Candidatus Pacearchaeota archaeon]